MRVRTSGAWKEVSSGRVRVAGAWKNLVRVRAYIGGAWKDVASFTQPYTALTVTPETIDRLGEVGTTVTTQSATGTPTGGRSPFTYAWTRVSGDTGFTIVSPTSATTTFRRFVNDEVTYTAVFRCTATDADGVSQNDTVTVEIQGFVLSPG